MESIKELKRKARENFKKHTIIFIIICAIASFIGSEYRGSLYIVLIGKETSFDSVVESLLENGVDATKAKIDDYIMEKKNKETELLGRTNGIFANSLNAISSGSLYMIGFYVFKNLISSPTVILAITIGIAAIIYILFWYYIVNIYLISERRIFLEGRIYSKVPFRRITYLSRIKMWKNAADAMFLKWVYESLWYLTIIGGVIKHYSYLMVPYILAENPNLKPKEVILLSQRMMDGHKLEAFKIELSFLGWTILGYATLGIGSITFTNPYKLATFVEFYVKLREIGKQKKIENIDVLNDKYLYEKAETELINKEYADVLKIIKQKDYTFPTKKGLKHAILEFLGIHSYTEEEKNYEKQQLKNYVVDEYTPVLNGERYPFRLYTIKPKGVKRRIESLNYLRNYSLNSIIYIFFIISFIGWLWEFVIYLVNEGIFVNRGILHGPWLPIYGGGSIFILLFLNKFRKNILLQFTLAVILCGTLEYFTSVYLEAIHGGARWWDYSGYFLNLHGRICAEGMLTFGFGGIAVVYIIAPAIDNKIREMNKKVLAIIATILISIYAIDNIYSIKYPNTGRGINDYEVQYKNDKN